MLSRDYNPGNSQNSWPAKSELHFQTFVFLGRIQSQEKVNS